MCGIVGIFSKSPAVGDRLGQLLARMLVQMGDRGPDSAGVAIYRDPVGAGASKLSLASAEDGVHWGEVQAAIDGALVVKPGADVIVLDGMQGGTAATQDAFIEHVGIPTLAAIPPAVESLQELGLPARCSARAGFLAQPASDG